MHGTRDSDGEYAEEDVDHDAEDDPTKPVLGYWDIRGAAQQIRFLLTYLQVDFRDKRYKQGDAPDYSIIEWTNQKYTLGLDFPNLPFYIDEDVKLTETLAIMNYISLKYKPASMLGKTDKDRATVSMLSYVLMELGACATKPCYQDMSSREEIGDKMLANIEPIIKHMEKTGSKFLVGNTVTFVDFMLFELCERI